MTTTTTAANKELVRDYFDAWAQGDVDGITALLADDYTLHYTGADGEDRTLDRERFREEQINYFETFSELGVNIHSIVAEVDQVMMRITWSGVQEGPFMGIEPTGNHVSVEEYLSFRVEEGKLVDGRLLADSLGLVRQLDVDLPMDA